MFWGAILGFALLPSIAALTSAQLRERSIYQVLTDRFARHDGHRTPCNAEDRVYCGGTWKGIELQLEYIQGMGFDTVWISPVVANIPGISGSESYHGYWASDIFQLNDRFGSRQDLLDLANALHARGMYLMVDVVANHLGTEPGLFEPGTWYGPFTSDEHFHPFCIPDDWDNQIQSEQCWLTDHMADLNTEHPQVIGLLHTWINHLVSSFGIDAIRVDTVKHVRKEFWPGFIQAAGVAAMGEVLHGDPAYLRRYQQHAMGSLLDYATFYHLRRAFQSTSSRIDELTSMISRVHQIMPNPTVLGSFLEYVSKPYPADRSNHDHPRLASSVRDPALLKNAAVYPFINDGFPILFQGTEHWLTGGDDPANREAIWLAGYRKDTSAYDMYARLNHARRRASSHSAYLNTLLKFAKFDTHSVLISKAPMLSVLTNYGASAPPKVYYISKTGYAPLIPVIDVLTGQVFATDPHGGLSVVILSGEPRVFLPLAIWEGRESVWQAVHNSVKAGVTQSTPPRQHPDTLQPETHSKSSSFGSVFSWLRGYK